MSDTINDEKELEILETTRAAAEAPEKAGDTEPGAKAAPASRGGA
jgi:hypothetical protein